MAPLIVRGFAQIWDRKIGMSKSKEAFIQTVEEKKKLRLVVCFNTGEYTTFQLINNIKNVVFRSYGENQNHLHLTFQNDNFLFIERLSSRDAEQLKMFLDRVHQNNLQPPMRPCRDGGVFAGTTTQKEMNKTSFHKVCKRSSSAAYETGEGNGIPDLKKMPLFTSKLSTLTCKELLEKRCEKRKKMLSSGSEMNENFPKENNSVRNKESKRNPLKYASHNEKKKSKIKELRESEKLEFGRKFKTDFTGNPFLDGTALSQILYEKMYLAFLLEPKFSEDDPEWKKLKMTFDSYPEKLWEGLPNLGNTCYMNAVLQSLFSIPSFADDLLNQGFPWGKIPFDVSTCLAQLLVLKDIYNVKLKEKLLVKIKKTISAVAGIFSGNKQNDAHEFLGHCLDQIKENKGKINSIWKTKIESEEENSPQPIFASNAATEVLVCPVITNFEFELLCSIICKACGKVVLKREVSNYLSINLPQGMKALPLSIQSTFDLYFGVEELEYKCEKCKHKSSVAVHKFSRLPRVLIVHLKRYSFNESWSLRKDDQEVIISKYLKLSSHCNESTKPPLPLSKNIRTRDFQILKILQKMHSEAISSLTASTNLASESRNSVTPHTGSDKEPEPQKYQIVNKGTGREQQKKELEKYSKLNIIESKLVNSAHGRIIEKELLAAGLMTGLKDASLSQTRGGERKSTSSPGTCLAVHSQEVLEHLKLKKYEKTHMLVDFENVTETTEDFYGDKKPRIPEGFRRVAQQIQQCKRMRIYEQALQQALLQSLPKPDAQWYTERLRRPTELSLQEAHVNSLGALGSNKNPGNKDLFDMEKTEAKAKKPKRNAEMGDSHAYRLIAVVSHLGKTPDSGHYISDAYDFERQVWFTYNDLQVASIQEAVMQEARLCTGYIFFYMHNEIFEELLGREGKSQPFNTKAGETPQGE
ncbi:ubiquitin carboxyl-terminal hydrolase 26 [Diceros bicornis minor]|uniref:ubiquitin carboxyl-terminal hydrolase 26 n=1 Tax=Diceros bicornis minor TaxID=77932 RepID=UPI0026F04BCE|nr:ubiquitin carboxyl-terminal hydrolase 26 [Diceros bicornis minor]XP_058392718.1 ubiquitin carboxyl-terminal hydrolase 26 [Diceros bicornis minor]XP_058392719.1 ubiquitin carboxyl-terminal hydrolase 26 [Diceros bicornis minor]XP_058392720.1 ubiquitin carboxyl-terminal hydrolase 26 [Diceros bicornis minor]XP_058392721.1 ubiquitin carboxyl-terminal hydrolase 26 [Diceros bicornis minor]XP_058392722.1 ubiquitin carboxyl-terminal hydrolase 26 [Diceros bicornis minor]XP_058392723.1 ubiquitin carb